MKRGALAALAILIAAAVVGALPDLRPYDLVLFGEASADAGHAQVGFRVAAALRRMNLTAGCLLIAVQALNQLIALALERRFESDIAAIGPLGPSVTGPGGGYGAMAFAGADGWFLAGLMRRMELPIAARWAHIVLNYPNVRREEAGLWPRSDELDGVVLMRGPLRWVRGRAPAGR